MAEEKQPDQRLDRRIERLLQKTRGTVRSSQTIPVRVQLTDPHGPAPGLRRERTVEDMAFGQISLADIEALIDSPNVLQVRMPGPLPLRDDASLGLNVSQILAEVATVVRQMGRSHVDARLHRAMRRLNTAPSQSPDAQTPDAQTAGAESAEPTDTVVEAAPEEVDVMARLRDRDMAVPGLKVNRQLGDIVTGSVSSVDFAAVSEHDNVISLRSSRPIYHDLERSVREIRADPATLRSVLPEDLRGLDGRGVIVGIIDTDADFAHANFRDEHGNTRLLALWDQRGGKTGMSPRDFGYGREYLREKINAALRTSTPYTHLGYTPRRWDPRRSSGSHGTFVMDIAAGNGQATGLHGVAPGAELIFVHAETDGAVAGTSAFGYSKNIAEAALYIFETAAAMGKPAVLNISMSAYGGPHDGSTLVDRWFEALLQVPDRAIVVAAGNAWTDRIHAAGQVHPETPRTLGVEIPLLLDQPAAAADSEIEIWYDGQQALEIAVIEPGGKRYGPVSPGEVLQIKKGDRVVLDIFHTQHDPDNGDNHVDILMDRLLSGNWTVELVSAAGEEVPFHAWIEREPTYIGQARFSIADEVRSHTLGSLSCGQKTIVVGSYKSGSPQRAISPFSSQGPTRDGRQKPELSAPGQSVDPFLEMGIACAQAQIPLPIRQSGTSIAAPHVTGVIALMLQSTERKLSVDEIRAALTTAARRGPPEGGEWHPRYGFGRVNGAGSILAINEKGDTDLVVDAPEEIEGMSALVAALGRIARASNAKIRINIEVEPRE